MTNSIDSIISDLRAAKDRHTVPKVWREDPVPLKIFNESIEYCNLPPLTPIQYTDSTAVLGEDPKKMFDPTENTGITTAVFLWGKGSGKDYLTSLIQLYCIYVILCLENAQEYFNQAPGEPLDVVNVAHSGEQAKNVYFNKFLEKLKGCKWFKTHFNMIQSGRLMGKRNPDAWGEVRVGATSVVFPHNIRAISETSENESFEGYNIIVWIMDEASAFRSAKKIENAARIYNTLKSSANTRFIGRWKGFVLSYPRAEDDWDFTIQKYKETLDSVTMHGSRHFSWEVAPPTTYPGGKFKFVYDRQDNHIEMDVPVTLREEFTKFPETSLGTYCCMPGRSEGAFIEVSGAIPRVLNVRVPVFQVESIVVESPDEGSGPAFRGLGYQIVKWNQKEFDRLKKYVIHIDCSLSQDRAALVLAHGEPILVELEYQDGHKEHRWIQNVVEDAHVVYEPDAKRNLRVSLNNIADLVLQIAKVVPLTAVTFDHWQSASAVETLALQGINVKAHNINREDYVLLRSIIYSGDADFLKDDLTEQELIMLRKAPGGNVDHPTGGSKDLADALAGVTRLILGEARGKDQPKQQQDVGMPIAATAYAHKSSPASDFNVGTASAVRSTTRPTSGRSSTPIGIGKVPLPDLPPMPFGLGSPDRPRPQIRTLAHNQPPSAKRKMNSPIDARIKELS